MKLLGWMHRKFRQNNGVDPFKDFALGRPSLHEQQQNHQHFLPKRPSKDQRHHFRNSFAGLDDANAAAQDDEDHHPFEEDELFQGLLAIGTLGSDPSLGAADHHRASVETITEKDTDVTPDELKLINEELEKVLGMEVKEVVKEVKDDTADVSSGRNSHVAIVAVSSGKPSSVEAASAENAAAVCPLQGYLFGSPIELPEAKVAAKEHRTSLGELFQRSRMAEEGGGGRNSGGGGKWDREEKREGGGGEKSGVQLVKKMLKRRVKGTCDSVSAETKLNKILHIFHRKVHPESSTSAKKSSKSEGHDMKGNIRNDGAGDGGDRLIPDHDIIVFPERAIRKEGVRRQKCRSNPPPFALSGSDSNGNREYWIKTDADYLVLEL
ncbi:protein LAZY 1 [Cinnamomum micranthum f. kanehirae]|uniref:Protein LAZY 1 n=1 Tax=Cinnamomum micranthum f. kanehirae TaxID=337451 RepID=A0A443P8H7_9MAGN|nr:protein LAZY 1 [Cinnamomum micranthum f. kanehirae]